MSVTGIIVTRGDHNYAPSLGNWPLDWQRIVWDNGKGICRVWHPEAQPFEIAEHPVADLAVYGRYAAIEYGDGDLIYVQDDDVIVSDPDALVAKWVGTAALDGPVPADGSDLTNVASRNHVVCNMPQEFRHEGYTDSALVGFGAVFHRDAPTRAFDRLHWMAFDIPDAEFHRECDTTFTMLTPRVLVDVPKVDREFASAPDRLWLQPEHQAQREKMRRLVRQVRDAE